MVGVAATIGNQFELWLLAVACNTSEYEARNTLNGAIRSFLPLFKFLNLLYCFVFTILTCFNTVKGI